MIKLSPSHLFGWWALLLSQLDSLAGRIYPWGYARWQRKLAAHCDDAFRRAQAPWPFRASFCRGIEVGRAYALTRAPAPPEPCWPFRRYWTWGTRVGFELGHVQRRSAR
jgi:hypothetical protein